MRQRLTSALVCCVAVLGTATACSGGANSGAAASPGSAGTTSADPSSPGQPISPGHPISPSPSTSPTPQRIPGGDPQLAKIVLTTTEVARAGTPVVGAVYRGGFSVKGQPTLDECHATYPSETKRVARIQLGYLAASDPHGEQTASNEVVRYSRGGATEAYHEITHSLATCPRHFSDGGKAIGSHTTVDAKDPLLVHDQVTATQLVAIGHRQLWSAITFLYAGDLFSGVYVFRSTRGQALTADRLLSRISSKKLVAAATAEGTLV